LLGHSPFGYAPGGNKPDEWMTNALKRKKVLATCKREYGRAEL
jgi:hypothetical protein